VVVKTPPTIAERRARIAKRLARAQADLSTLQGECEHAFAKRGDRANQFSCECCGMHWMVKCDHANAKRVARAEAGGYDPSNDHYWYEFSCGDCGKFWTEDQP
jgi:hypothetical protein